MEKVIIIGCGGAGKSTLARKLSKILNLKVYHLDAMYWKPGWEMTAKDEWEKLINQVIEEDSWIMDGNYGSTMDMRAQAAGTIIFLGYSTPRCLYGVFKRRIMYHRRTRTDMNEGCPERLDWEFIKWVARYKREKAPDIITKLEELKLQGKEIFHFTNPRETDEFLKELINKRRSIN
ncbi:DNA topology modulation protein [Mesobacillus subterraneus]|uniref:DNA topology modulation protein n=1 Tax=Mesobacillus subterraneus TaxID=285983 RepID=UPI00273DF97F|nr:DNA topology modulation protein [Mesobacillus subterraneus]WLR53902.1 DNA topology modulation protein [Mesobacillus subterraneus]